MLKDVPISFSDWERQFGDMPPAVLKNRFFEKNPAQAKGVAMLARQGTSEFDSFGDGPNRSFYSLPGLFSGAFFAVSKDKMFREDTDGTKVTFTGTVYGSGSVSMCGVKGAAYQHLFIADGSHLQLYQGGTHASGTLTGTGHVSDGDTIQIGATYYQWATSVSDGSGTSADPWKVLIGSDLVSDLVNMVNAISFDGVPGTDFSSNLGGQNSDVTAVSDSTTLTVTAISDQTDANSLATTVPTGSTVSWGAATLSGGGTHGLSGVEVPNGSPPGFLATLGQYVFVSIVGSDEFYFIKPGEITLNALDFETAESHPDATIAMEVTGDSIVFVGTDSIERWYLTGDTNAPIAPIKGATFNFGALEGTVFRINDTIFFIGSDYVAYSLTGLPTRISNHGVEELIRLSLGA